MPGESKKPNLDNLKQWADDLACPVCYAQLRFEKATVVCSGCGSSYPVVDGIPVLIPRRATLPSTS
ncbi:MAG: Trm112 family protein [Terracidiphilus sp.]